MASLRALLLRSGSAHFFQEECRMILTVSILAGVIIFFAIVFWLEPVGTPRDEARIDTDPTGMGDEGPEDGRKARKVRS